MDIVTSEQRSKNMSAILSKNTKPEIYFRKLLFAEGYRYSLNAKKISGHPDIYLKKYNTAVFINGCFWHHHEGCKYAYMPKSRVEFWRKKFETNQQRDIKVRQELEKKRIKRLVVWECTIKKMYRDKEIEKSILIKTEKFLISGEYSMEL